MSPLIEVVRRAGWAPIAAVVVQQAAVWWGVRREADPLVHFCGGAAAAYFVLRGSQAFAHRLGISRRATHWLVAFAGARTAALSCELVEFTSDQWLGSHAQESLRETMLDLVFGVAGALAALAVAWVFERRACRIEDPQAPGDPHP